MARRSEEDYDYLEDAFDDEKNAADMIEAQKANSRGCLIALIVGVVGLIAIGIVAFGVLSSLVFS